MSLPNIVRQKINTTAAWLIGILVFALSLQADLRARPYHANRAHDPTARRALLRPEHMLDTSAYPALGVVRPLLRRRPRVVASTGSVMASISADR